jgi:hypothetical protein
MGRKEGGGERSGRERKDGTYSGNFPLTRATYSLRTFPVVKSLTILAAVFGLRATNMSPEVSRSSRFTAVRKGSKGDRSVSFSFQAADKVCSSEGGEEDTDYRPCRNRIPRS